MSSAINDKHLRGEGEKFLSKRQAAAEFGIHYRTLERWLNYCYLESFRMGSRVYIPYSEVVRIKDRFPNEKPNGNYMESQIRTFDDIYRRIERRQGHNNKNNVSAFSKYRQ